MEETPEKIPLEAIVKWLDKQVKTLKHDLSHYKQVNQNQQKKLVEQTKEITSLTLQVRNLTDENEALRKDAKKSEWFKLISQGVSAQTKSYNDLKRRYNSVLSQLNQLRDKYGE